MSHRFPSQEEIHSWIALPKQERWPSLNGQIYEAAENPEIVGFPECAALLAGNSDANVRYALAGNSALNRLPAVAERLAGDANMAVRRRLAGNPGTPLSVLTRFEKATAFSPELSTIHPSTSWGTVRPNRVGAKIRRALARNPALSDLPPVAEIMAQDIDPAVREGFAGNFAVVWYPKLAERLAADPDTRVRRALAGNEIVGDSSGEAVRRLVEDPDMGVFRNLAGVRLRGISQVLRRRLAVRLLADSPKLVARLFPRGGLSLSLRDAQRNPALAGAIGKLSATTWRAIIPDPAFQPELALRNPHLPEAIRVILAIAVA